MSSSRKPPPATAPWTEPLNEAPLAFVDLEMTGLDPSRHRVVEICIERVVGSETTERLETYVRPEPLPDQVGNHHVHGIERASLSSAPTFPQLAERVCELVDGAVMVAHGARWDAAFLSAEMRRAEHSWLTTHHIDTLALARRVLTAENYKLATLTQMLGITNAHPHRAGSDVAATQQLFGHLIRTLRERESTALTPRTVWDRCVGLAPVDPAILNTAETAMTSRQHVSIRYRAARGGTQELEFVVTQVRRDLDPPVVLGYLHHTRGRRELRVDRILSLELVAK